MVPPYWQSPVVDSWPPGRRWRVPCVRVTGGLPPRATLGYLFTPMLVMLARLGLISDQKAPMAEAIEVLRELAPNTGPASRPSVTWPKS